MAVEDGYANSGNSNHVLPDSFILRMHKMKIQPRPDFSRENGGRVRTVGNNKSIEMNDDGILTRDEVERYMPHVSRHFDEVDTNRDGVLSRDEVRVFREKRMQQRVNGNNGDPRFYPGE